MQPVFLQGLQDVGDEAVASTVRNIILQATGDLSWLSNGDTVLLKPALNSPDPYPATTHPAVVQATAALCAERGARVVIGDQSGIEHVLHHPGGVLRGSTAANFVCSGMAVPGDPRFIGFEDGGWDGGFFHYRSGRTASWKDGFFITTRVKEADHIISLPRVSSHSMAGATLGFKNMVGLLREDSRMEFHANGPMNPFILRSAGGSSLVSHDDGSSRFFEKIVEISDAVRDKLRLTLSAATVVPATFGPDRYGIRLGPAGLGRAYTVLPPSGLVFCSADPVAAEAMALAVLKDSRHSVPFLSLTLERLALFKNPLSRLLDSTAVRDHPYIRHATAIGLGTMEGQRLVAKDVPAGYLKRLCSLTGW